MLEFNRYVESKGIPVKTIKEVNENQIVCVDSDGYHWFGNVISWISLLESSNRALEMMKEEKEREEK